MYSRPRPSATPAPPPCAQNRARLDGSSASSERAEGRTVFALAPLPFAPRESARIHPECTREGRNAVAFEPLPFAPPHPRDVFAVACRLKKRAFAFQPFALIFSSNGLVQSSPAHFQNGSRLPDVQWGYVD